MTELPPKPPARADKVALWKYIQLFRRDILSAQPEKLYKARMAEFKTPLFRSFLINEPELIAEVLQDRPLAFPKSDRVGEGLRPLLGNSVFLTNGDTWQRQRRIIDPAFEGGRLRDNFAAMQDAGRAALARLTPGAVIDAEEMASFLAADIIFRTLFSVPIEDKTAAKVYRLFRAYQRLQPIVNLRALAPWPKWLPNILPRKTRAIAGEIRGLVAALTQARQAQIAAGTAPDDLATKIMTTKDPETGEVFSTEEMIDQVAIFFLAGHETSASALAWALYLLATHPQWQDKLAQEAQLLGEDPTFASVAKLKVSRDVFRETLRLYPPVPMMVREAAQTGETFRARDLGKGAQIVISPWHLHRHTRHWDNPDGFDPGRWSSDAPKACPRDAYLPFSKGARVCPGAGFAMLEGPLMLSMLLREYQVEALNRPIPEAHLTVRSRNGIKLRIGARESAD